MTLSIYPADVAKRAAVVWGHSQLVICPTCKGPGLVGYLDGKVVGYACHRCGPIAGIKKPSDRDPRGAARLASEGEIVAGRNELS